MALDISRDTQNQLREFERKLREEPSFRDQYLNNRTRTVEQAVTDRLFRLLGGQTSANFRNRFTDNSFALQGAYNVKDYTRRLGDTWVGPDYSFTDFLTETVPTGNAFAGRNEVRDLFTRLPATFADSGYEGDPMATQKTGAYLDLRNMTPGDLYSLYATQYRPTASGIEGRRREREAGDYLQRFEGVNEQPWANMVLPTQRMAAQVDFAKYNTTVSEPYKNMGAKYVQTVTANDPTYLQEIEMFFPGMTEGLKDMTIGQVLRMQADYWQSPAGQRHPLHQNAISFATQYGYWPSLIEVKTGKSGIGAGDWPVPVGPAPIR